jgi:hypothetical protein
MTAGPRSRAPERFSRWSACSITLDVVGQTATVVITLRVTFHHAEHDVYGGGIASCQS